MINHQHRLENPISQGVLMNTSPGNYCTSSPWRNPQSVPSAASGQGHPTLELHSIARMTPIPTAEQSAALARVKERARNTPKRLFLEQGNLVDSGIPPRMDLVLNQPAQVNAEILHPGSTREERIALARHSIASPIVRSQAGTPARERLCNDSICSDDYCPGTPATAIGDAAQRDPAMDPGAPGTGLPCYRHKEVHPPDFICYDYTDNGKRIRHREIREAIHRRAEEKVRRDQQRKEAEAQAHAQALAEERARALARAADTARQLIPPLSNQLIPPVSAQIFTVHHAQVPHAQQNAFVPIPGDQRHPLPQNQLHAQPVRESQTRSGDAQHAFNRMSLNGHPDQQNTDGRLSPAAQHLPIDPRLQGQSAPHDHVASNPSFNPHAASFVTPNLQQPHIPLGFAQRTPYVPQFLPQVPLQPQEPQYVSTASGFQFISPPSQPLPHLQPAFQPAVTQTLVADPQPEHFPAQHSTHWTNDTRRKQGNTIQQDSSDSSRTSTPARPSRSPSPPRNKNWNISKYGWKMPTFDGKKPQRYVLDCWTRKWRVFQKEKGLKGINATWTLMELLEGSANDRITRKLGPRLLTLEDPEEIIAELEKIYDEAGGFRRAQEEFRDRDQAKSETMREYMDALQSLLYEIDPEVSQVSLNTAVFTRFIEGIRHKELHTSSSKHLLLTKANKLDKKNPSYLEEILKVAEAELETTKQENRSLNPSSSSREPVKDLREKERDGRDRKPLKKIEKEAGSSSEAEQSENEITYQSSNSGMLKRMDEFLMALEEAVGCFHCGKTGHFSCSCPDASKPQTQKGKEVQQQFNAERRERQGAHPKAQGGFNFKGFQRAAQPPKPAPEQQNQATQSADHDLLVTLMAKMDMMEGHLMNSKKLEAGRGCSRVRILASKRYKHRDPNP